MNPRAVFDCMVFVQALASDRGPARACFELVRDGCITLVVGAEIRSEVRQVLGRPQL